MKIKMLAIAPFDGWAFIIKEKSLYLLKPPYHSRDLLKSSEEELASAINRYHFREIDASFVGLADVVHFLKETYANEMKAMGVELPEPEQLKTLLEFATSDVLEDYLDKMEREFIPKRNLDAAELLALELLRLEKIKQDTVLYNRTLAIIDKCREEREQLKQFTERAGELSRRFPNAARKYTGAAIFDLAKGIRRDHQFLSIGA